MTEEDRSRQLVERYRAELATQSLLALSPLDGRYRAAAEPVRGCFSEAALIRHRVIVEVEYFLALLAAVSEEPAMSDAAPLSRWARELPVEAMLPIKELEAKLKHDVKAVEYAVKDRVRGTLLARHTQLVHLGLTSEDVNNLAYALMHQRALRGPLARLIRDLVEKLSELVWLHRATPMLGRTHGQPATPTTLGKELGVFLHRLVREAEDLPTLRLPGKLNGATGTYAAHLAAFPDADWPAFSREFVAGLGLEWSPVTTQIEPHDGLAALYDRLRRIGNILLDLCQDVWRYVSDGYFRQKAVAGEIGSSAMPHKINPIDFENAEGNAGLANALFAHLSDKLTRSRLQRDLSDSTVLRNAGVAFGHLAIALRSARAGLSRLEVDEAVLRRDLAEHPEVLAEAYQAALREAGHDAPYETLLELTRGRTVTLADLRDWLMPLAISRETKERLLALTPDTYIGLAPQVADTALAAARALLERYQPEEGE
ncbi:MAG: adenylosuccinate lyase [Candidatus Sericytochromatia bacterium]|nr:adenylosuccinate lyase [Candidatus Tanganyikabacteria bacterium]